MRFLLLFLIGCATSANIPEMSRPIKVWNGAPEKAGICRLGSTCLAATDEGFKKYACLTFTDLEVIYQHIQEIESRKP